MKKLFCLTVALLLIFSCGTQHKETEFRNKYMFSVKLDKANFAENISFNEELEMIIIPVIVNDKKYNFLFDTGSVTMVSTEFKDEIELINDNKTSQIADALGNKSDSEFAILPKITLGNVDFLNVGVNVVDLSVFENRCISIDGIIGANLMRTCFWKIDYKSKNIFFSDKKENIKISDPALKVSFNESFGGNPRTKFKWSKFDFWATWDTGYNNSMQIPDSLFFNTDDYKNLKLESGKGLNTATLYSKNNSTQSQYKSVLDSLFFIKKTNNKDTLSYIINQETNISPNPAPILIGNRFLKSANKVFFDWKNKEVSFEKSPVNKTNNTFGFTPFKIGNSIRVVSLWDNSVAKQQGLKIGDTLVSLNGENVKNLNSKEWCNQFVLAQKKDSINFIIEDKGNRKKYSLRKYSMFK